MKLVAKYNKLTARWQPEKVQFTTEYNNSKETARVNQGIIDIYKSLVESVRRSKDHPDALQDRQSTSC